MDFRPGMKVVALRNLKCDDTALKRNPVEILKGERGKISLEQYTKDLIEVDFEFHVCSRNTNLHKHHFSCFPEDLAFLT